MTPSDSTIIYVGMDHVLCNYDAGFRAQQPRYLDLESPQGQPGLYQSLELILGTIEAMERLFALPKTEVFILSAPPEKNPHRYSEERIWVEEHLDLHAINRLILSFHKGLCRGDYLIDDWDHGKGQEYFEAELIQFGTVQFPAWRVILDCLFTQLERRA